MYSLRIIMADSFARLITLSFGLETFTFATYTKQAINPEALRSDYFWTSEAFDFMLRMDMRAISHVGDGVPDP